MWRFPYREGETEFAEHTFTSGLASSYGRWGLGSFIRHFYGGGGRTVTLDEIGHLLEIAEYYAYSAGGDGAFRRLSDQIASRARTNGVGSFPYHFEGAYDFGSVQLAHGNAVVRGDFFGTVADRGEMLRIEGDSSFHFGDVFTDPLDLRDPNSSYRGMAPFDLLQNEPQPSILSGMLDDRLSFRESAAPSETQRSTWEAITDVGRRAYGVIGDWTASFVAEVAKDESRSVYVWKG